MHQRFPSVDGEGFSTELDMGLRPTHWDENWIEFVRVGSRERKFCFARSAASTPGGSDEDGGD